MSVDYLSLECCNNVPHPVCTALVFTPYSLVLPINHVCHLLSSVFCLQLSISLLSLYFPFSSRPFFSLSSLRWPNAFTIGGNPPQPKIPFPEKKSGRRGNSRNTMGAKVPTSIMGSPRSSSTLPKANPRQFQPVSTVLIVCRMELVMFRSVYT